MMNKNLYLLIIIVIFQLFFSQCCTSKSELKDDNKIMRNNYPPPSLSPGTADVTATILKLIIEKSKVVGLFKIDTVHAYGSSTRPIGVGSQLNIEFSKILLENSEREISKIFKQRTKHKLTISLRHSAFKRDKTESWQIIKVKSNIK